MGRIVFRALAFWGLALVCVWPTAASANGSDDILSFMPPILGVARGGSLSLPDTGQVKCYDDSGEVACPDPGQDYYGQDGVYQGAQPSYRDNNDGTITDLVTGFLWQKADDGVKRFWIDAVSYCSNLTLGGHSDWRLPSVKELQTIIDAGRVSPAINPVFSCASEFYPSGTVGASDPAGFWGVDFGDGSTTGYPKGGVPYRVRCVRVGP